MLRPLIIRSRVRRAEDCSLMRPYSPALFRQGAAPRLLERQRGTIKEDEALRAAWKKHEDKDEKESARDRGAWPWAMPLPCRGCSDTQAKLVEYPLQAFASPVDGVTDHRDWAATHVPQVCPRTWQPFKGYVLRGLYEIAALAEVQRGDAGGVEDG